MVKSISDILKLKPTEVDIKKGILNQKFKMPFNGILLGEKLYEKIIQQIDGTLR